jgi:hypothetical protein
MALTIDFTNSNVATNTNVNAISYTTGTYGNTTTGGSTVNTIIFAVGNSSVNAFVNSTILSIGGNNIANSTGANNAFNLGGTAAASYVQNTDSRTLSGNLNFTGTNVYFTAVNFGSVGTGTGGIISNTTTVFVGNNTVNTVITSAGLTVNGTAVVANSSGVWTSAGQVNAASHTTGATGLGTGGIIANTTTVFIGNNTVNTVANNSSIYISGTLIANSTGPYGKTEATLSVNAAAYLGTVAAASYVQNTDSRTLSGNLNFTGTNVYFTAVNFGSVGTGTGGIISNTTTVFVGNNTVNTVITSAGLNVNTSTIANSSQVYSPLHTTGGTGLGTGGFIANNTIIFLGNNTINASINTTSLYIGGNVIANSTGANNAFNLGGTAASSYQLNSTLAANVATMAANSSTYANSSVTNTFTVGSSAYFVANGNFGLGTNTPSYSFVVFKNQNAATVSQIINSNTGASAAVIMQSQIGASSYVNYSTYATYNQIVGSGITTQYIDFDTQYFRNTAGTERMRIDSSGNVGIGNISPNYKLDVNGGFQARGIVAAFPALTGNTTTSLDATQLISLGTSSSWGASGVSFSVSDSRILDITIASNTALAFRASSTAQLQYLAGSNYFNANVGIMTSSPAYRLDVTGDIRASANIYGTLATTSQPNITANNTSYLGGTAAASYQLNSTLAANVATMAANSSTYANSSVTNTFTVGTSAYFVANGNVGIGVSTPGVKLYLASTTDIVQRIDTSGTTTAAFLSIRNGSGVTSSLNSYVEFLNNDTNNQSWRVGTYGGNDLSIYNAKTSTYSYTFAANGNLGIGNTTPGVKLEVNGDIRASGSVTTGNSTVYAIVNSTSHTWVSSTAAAITISKPSANGSRIDITSGANVASAGFWNGVHFATPIQFTNSTSGTAYPRTSHYYEYTSAVNPSDLYYYIRAGNDSGIGTGIRLYSSTIAGGAGGIDIAANGNIGIANTTPGVKLEVTGDIRASANLYGTLATTSQPYVTANNSSYLGGTAAASFVQNTDSRTLSGNLAFTGANITFTTPSLGTTSGNYVNNFTLNTNEGNGSLLRFYTYRHTTGGDWTGASTRIQQRIDVTDQAMLEFNPSGYLYGVALKGGTAVQGLIVDANGQTIHQANIILGSASVAVGLQANGGYGTAGQLLTSNGTATYWSTVSAPSYTFSTGLVNTSSTITVNASYIATISANNASYLGGYAASSTAATANRIVQADVNGYIFNNYFNSSDDSGTAAAVTYLMSKKGDNYLRSANASAVATFLNTTLNSQFVKRVGGVGVVDLNSATYYTGSQVVGYDAATNRPGDAYGVMLNMQERGDTAGQFAIDYSTGTSYTRGILTSAPTFSAWRTLLNNSNYASYVSQLTSLGVGVAASGTTGRLSLSEALYFTTANPYIQTNNGSSQSYFHAPGGAYFNSGTVYTEANFKARGGIGNDTGTYLYLSGGAGTGNPVYISGRLGVGNTAPEYSIEVNGAIGVTSTSTYGLYIGGNQINSGPGYNALIELAFNYTGYAGGSTQFRDVRIFDGKTASVCLFQGSDKGLYNYGNVTAYYSDARLKKDIKPIENAIDKVKQISGVTYTSNELAASFGYTSKEEQVGVIAHEIEAVLPQAVKIAPFDMTNIDGVNVSKSGENYKTVQYEKIVPLLIEAIKELTAKVEKLEKEKNG